MVSSCCSTTRSRTAYDLPGAQDELRALQRAAQERLPRQGVHFTSRFEDTLAFIDCGPGLEYWKLPALSLLEQFAAGPDDCRLSFHDDSKSPGASALRGYNAASLDSLSDI